MATAEELAKEIEALKAALLEKDTAVEAMKIQLRAKEEVLEIERRAKEEVVALARELRDKGVKKNKVKITKPDKFKGDGSQLASVWLFQMESYFVGEGVPEDRFTRDAASNLESHAAIWWTGMSKKDPRYADTYAWDDFKEELKRAFKHDNDVQKARDELAGLDMTRLGLTTSEYVRRFREITLRIPDLSDSESLYRFKRGLRGDIYFHVGMLDPRNTWDAMIAAEKVDV